MNKVFKVIGQWMNFQVYLRIYQDFRHINGDINWAVSNKGFGYNFENNSILKSTLQNQRLTYDLTDNFTLEFWFKTQKI